MSDVYIMTWETQNALYEKQLLIIASLNLLICYVYSACFVDNPDNIGRVLCTRKNCRGKFVIVYDVCAYQNSHQLHSSPVCLMVEWMT